MQENKQHTEIARQAMEEMQNNVASSQQGSPNKSSLLHAPKGSMPKALKPDDDLNLLGGIAVGGK